MKVFTEVIAQGSQKATTQSQVNDKYRLLLAIKKDSGLKHLFVGFTFRICMLHPFHELGLCHQGNISS